MHTLFAHFFQNNNTAEIQVLLLVNYKGTQALFCITGFRFSSVQVFTRQSNPTTKHNHNEANFVGMIWQRRKFSQHSFSIPRAGAENI